MTKKCFFNIILFYLPNIIVVRRKERKNKGGRSNMGGGESENYPF
jgi:hypothetical protein